MWFLFNRSPPFRGSLKEISSNLEQKGICPHIEGLCDLLPEEREEVEKEVQRLFVIAASVK